MSAQKAYTVLEENEWTGGVVFATSNVEARRFGANEFNEGEFSGLTVRRAPNWDKYQDTGVPISEMICDGWNFECHGCGSRLTDDWFYEQGMTPTQAVGVSGGSVYCCWQCEAEDRADRAARKAYGETFLGIIRDRLRKRFGEVSFPQGTFRQHVLVRQQQGQFLVQHATVAFEFPGMEIGPAHARYDQQDVGFTYHGSERQGPPQLLVLCCNGDREAFETFAAQTLTP